jgi:hypothetical protein
MKRKSSKTKVTLVSVVLIVRCRGSEQCDVMSDVITHVHIILYVVIDIIFSNP